MNRLSFTSLSLVVWFSVVAVSQPVLLGTLSPIFHETSGTLYAVDEKTFFIKDFQYDGQGVVTYIYVYLTGQTVNRRGGGIIINWSSTQLTVPLRRFRSENITISMTANETTAHLNVSNIQTFTVWCEPFKVFFTRLDLPTNASIPQPAGPTVSIPPVVMSCVQLHSDFQVTWTHTDSHIKIKQCGCISEDQYMAFGISGSNTSTDMIGADVVVTWINDDGPNAIDYYLTGRQQCRAGQGVCPDTLISGGGGSQDVGTVTGSVMGGMRCIQYTRLLTTNDSNDRPYLINNQTQFVAWAYGPRATEEGLRDLAFFHTEYPRNGANFQLNFAQSMQCSEPLQCMEETVCGWEGLSMTAMEPTTFTVKIGLSGGLRGYQAITGLSGWGIAYYINDTMAPVLKLKRGVTYTFIVEAGNDPNDGPRYHPFYITDSIDGGILLDSPEDRMRKNEQVYAGYNMETNEPTAAGRYCTHEETAGSASVAEDCDSTLQNYLDTLSVSCEGDESEAAVLTWTPDENTPDVVYYQCANHVHLGWRIELMNATINASAEVNNNMNTGMEKNTDTGIENTTDIGMGNTTDTGMGNTTDTGMGNATDPGIKNTTDVGMGNTTDRNATDVGMGSKTDIGMGNTTDMGMGNTTDMGMGNATDPGVENTTDVEMGNTTDIGMRNTTDVGMGNTTDMGMGNATDPGVENTTDVEMGNTTDIGMRNTTDVGMGNTTDMGMGNATDPGVENTTDVGMGNATDIGIGNTTDVMGNATNMGMGNTTDPGMENATDIGMRNTTDVRMGNTTDVKMGNTTNVKMGNTTNIEMRNVTDTGIGNSTILFDEMNASENSGSLVRTFYMMPWLVVAVTFLSAVSST